MRLTVEKTFGIPPYRNARYPFAEMDVGDSVLVPSEAAKNGYTAARMFKMRHAGWNYTSRHEADGSIRIWRTT